jgi:hypothetical protein
MPAHVTRQLTRYAGSHFVKSLEAYGIERADQAFEGGILAAIKAVSGKRPVRTVLLPHFQEACPAGADACLGLVDLRGETASDVWGTPEALADALVKLRGLQAPIKFTKAATRGTSIAGTLQFGNTEYRVVQVCWAGLGCAGLGVLGWAALGWVCWAGLLLHIHRCQLFNISNPMHCRVHPWTWWV